MKKHLYNTTILVLFLSLSLVSFGQTTHLTVGCEGAFPDFSTLRGAFQWVETNYFPGDVDISICPGIYYEDAYINPFALSGPGHEIRIHSSTLNPADVTIHPFSPSHTEILRINGVENMRFEALTLEVQTLGSASSRHAVRTLGGAGNISFRHCEMIGIAPSTPGYNPDDYSVVEVEDLQSTLQFFNSELSSGGMGIHIQSVLGTSVLNFQNSSIFLTQGDGIREDVPVFLTQIDNSHINCYGPGQWNGITTQYGPDTYLNVNNTTITTYGAERCHGILAQSHNVALVDNHIRMAEHQKAYGVTVSGETYDSEITGNEVDYPGMMYTAVRPDSFMGIHREQNQMTNISINRIQITENQVECNGAEKGMGIFVDFKVEHVINGLFVRENEVHLENMGGEGASWLSGIALKSQSISHQNKLEVMGNQIYLEPLEGRNSKGLWVAQFLLEGHGIIYNNVIEVAQAGTDSSNGLDLANLKMRPGFQTYVGNNAVSLESTGKDATNGMYLHMVSQEDYKIWHNSIHVHGLPSAKPSDALHVWGYLYGGQFELIDNIFSNTTDGRAFHNSLYTGNWAFSNSNCYYSNPGTDLGAWGTTPLPNLSDVIAVSPSSGDLQSVQMDPVFAAPNNLHLSNSSPLLGINGIHLSFFGPHFPLNWDFEGDGRLPSNNREIGCDERGLPEINDTILYKVAQAPEALSLRREATLAPNPCEKQVHFEWKGHGNGVIELVHVQGKVLRTWSSDLSGEDLDLSGIPTGIYLVRAHDGFTTIAKRLVIR